MNIHANNILGGNNYCTKSYCDLSQIDSMILKLSLKTMFEKQVCSHFTIVENIEFFYNGQLKKVSQSMRMIMAYNIDSPWQEHRLPKIKFPERQATFQYFGYFGNEISAKL